MSVDPRVVIARDGGVAAGRDVNIEQLGLTGPDVIRLVELAKSPEASDHDELARVLAERIPVRAPVEAQAISNFLRILGESNIPEAQIVGRLEDIAERHLELIERLQSFKNDDPAIAEFRNQAAVAIKRGDYDAAEAHLEQADEADARAILEQQESLDQRKRSRAATLGERGDLAKLRLRYRDAANHYAEAAGIVPEDDIKTRWRYEERRSRALFDLGNEFGDSNALSEVIALCRDQLLPLAPRAAYPANWAVSQGSLGNALSVLGHRHADAQLLEQATNAFRCALEEYPRNRHLKDWAGMQNNLGYALQKLGEHHHDETLMAEAADAYLAAMEGWKGDETALNWAGALNNYATMLQWLGDREPYPDNLERAVFAYRDVLKVWTRECAPLDWATTQNNLGNALSSLGERSRTEGTSLLKEAVVAYRLALRVHTFEETPVDWAMTQNNLGDALYRVGTIEGDLALLEQAKDSLSEALKVRTREQMPRQWSSTQSNLGAVFLSLGQIRHNPTWTRKAITALESSLEERPREQLPIEWAKAAGNLGEARRVLADQTSDLDSAWQALQQLTDVVSISRAAGHIPLAKKFAARIPLTQDLIVRLSGGRQN